MNGFVQILRLDQVVAAELLFRLDIRTVGGRELAVPHTDRRGRLGRLERFAADVVARLLDAFGEPVVLGHPLLQV